MKPPNGFVSLQDAAAMVGRKTSRSNWHTLADCEVALLLPFIIVNPATAELVVHQDPDIVDVITRLAQACKAGEIATACRSVAGGADELDPSFWRLPHWPNYFITGTVDVDLPRIIPSLTSSGVATSAGYERCTREIFVRRSDLERFIEKPPVRWRFRSSKPADNEPAETRAPQPLKQASLKAYREHQQNTKRRSGRWASRKKTSNGRRPTTTPLDTYATNCAEPLPNTK